MTMINKRLKALEAQKAKLQEEIEKETLRLEALMEVEISKLQEELASIKTYGGKKHTVTGVCVAGTKVVSPMTPELEAEILERFHRGETANTIRKSVHKSYYSIVGVLTKHGLSFESRFLPTGKKPYVSEAEIAAVEELLKVVTAEQILKNYPDMRSALVCVLYKSNTSGVISNLFVRAGCESGYSSGNIDYIAKKNGVTTESKMRKRTNSGYTGEPEIDSEILERFHRNERMADIRNATGKSYRVIVKVLSKYGLSFAERGLQGYRHPRFSKDKERGVSKEGTC